MVEDNVGRKNNNKFIFGISIPSLKISTTHNISIFLFLKSFNKLDRSVVLVFEVRAFDLYPTFLNCLFIKFACSIFSQKAMALKQSPQNPNLLILSKI